MKILFISLQLTLYFIFFPKNLISQKNSPPKPAADTAVLNLFEKNSALQWVKYFSGRLDDVSDVDISLGFDGKNCRGYLTYTESRTRLRLDGTFRDGEISLREVTGNDETSGFLRGKYANKRFDADWSNYNNTIGARLESEEVNVSQLGISHCGDNKWMNRYATKLNGAALEICLLRANNGWLTGYIWLEKEQKTYFLKGEMQSNGNYSLEATRLDGTSAGQLRGSMQYLQNLEVAWHTTGGGKQFFNFSLVETLAMGCYESANFWGSFDITYPKTKSTQCNAWLERQSAAWQNACKLYFQKHQTELIPAYRATILASAWSEIRLWSADFFCGTMSFSESWNAHPSAKPFNFDLKRNREITFEDIFIKNFDAQKWLNTQAQKQAPWLNGSDRAELREWLEKVGFPVWNLCREGIEMSTPFHPVFGRQRVLIDWEALKPYLKKDSIALVLMSKN